jgi:hypothetical protein
MKRNTVGNHKGNVRNFRSYRIATTLFVIIVTALIFSSSWGSIGFFGDNSEQAKPFDSLRGDLRPEKFNVNELPDPYVWADEGDYIISYDDPGEFNATTPDIAVAPLGSPFEGSVHAVWAEMNKTPEDPYFEIHYSMSDDERGIAWSNDEMEEGDKIISDTNIGKMTAGDASYPAIAIDPQGIIHVVWRQEFNDGTYEVLYSRSDDNGKTWTGFDGPGGDILVSWREGGGQDAFWINPPRIAISPNPIILHVVWSELYGGDQMEVMYSRSFDQGWSWTGAIGGDMMISDPGSQEYANEADIAVSGVNGRYVHVVWTQGEPSTGTSEVFYAASYDYGDPWEPERPISFVDADGFSAYRARIAAAENFIHVVWDQSGPEAWEVYYSGSFDEGQSFSGEGEDTMISFPDGNDVWYPVVATSDFGFNVVVVWYEADDTSAWGSYEIHESQTPFPEDPQMWSGINDDIVISWPDTAEYTIAHDPAIALSEFGRPQVVWSEMNIISSRGTNNVANRNEEVHYIPATTHNVTVHSGWNLISTPLIQNNTNTLNVLNDSAGDGGTNWNVVQSFIRSSPGQWKSYATYKPAFLNTLLDINHTMGLWIYITSLGDGELTFFGDYSDYSTITLKAGWNLVGYPAQNPRTVTNSFAGVTEFISAEGYNAVAPYRISQLAGSYMMQPGEAYWVQVSADTTWIIDW